MEIVPLVDRYNRMLWREINAIEHNAIGWNRRRFETPTTVKEEAMDGSPKSNEKPHRNRWMRTKRRIPVRHYAAVFRAAAK